MTMRTSDQQRLARLSRVEEGVTPLAAEGKTLRGKDAADFGRQLLLDAFGSQEAVEEEIRRGRPHIGQTGKPGTASPVIRARVDPDRQARLEAIERSTNKKRSTLLREAVDLLLAVYESGESRPVTVDSRVIGHLKAQLRELTKAVDELPTSEAEARALLKRS